MSGLRFRTKAALAAVVVAFLTLAAAFWGIRVEIREAILQSDRARLRGRARRVAKRVFAGLPLGTRAPEIGAVVCLPDGTVLGAQPSVDPAPIVPAWLVDLSVDRVGRATTETLADADGLELRALAEHFKPRDEHPAAGTEGGLTVVTYRSLAGIDELADAETIEALLMALPPALIVGLLSAWLLARSLARPLVRMASQAEAASDPAENSEVTGSGAGDELDALADVLNSTFARLRHAFAQQSRFTSDAAHELRTPFAAILGRSEVVLRRERTPDEYRDALADVRDVAARAARMVEGLLHLARLDARDEIEMEEVDVAALVEREVAAACERHAKSPALLRTEIAARECTVVGDEALLSLVIRNLIDNALTHGWSERGIDVRVRRDGPSLLVAVHDHGAGVPEDHIATVFDRMHRVDMARSRALGGAGLGLSIVRAVAQAHGGDATLTSSPGDGTTVTVELPARP